MEKIDDLRKYLIYVLKNYQIYYITKNKVDREVYKLDELKEEIREANEIANELFAIKNNEIRNNGVASNNIEILLKASLENLAYLIRQKKIGNYIDINDEDAIEDIVQKIKNICVDEEIDTRVHHLTSEEEKILEEAVVNELKTVSGKGIEEEEKYLKEKSKKEPEEDFIDEDEEIAPAYSLLYKLRKSREEGIDSERIFLGQK